MWGFFYVGMLCLFITTAFDTAECLRGNAQTSCEVNGWHTRNYIWKLPTKQIEAFVSGIQVENLKIDVEHFYLVCHGLLKEQVECWVFYTELFNVFVGHSIVDGVLFRSHQQATLLLRVKACQ